MTRLQTLDELKDWKTFRATTKERLKQLAPGASERLFVARADLDFDLGGKPWSGRAFFVGEKGAMEAKRFKQQGVLLLEGTCRLEGKTLTAAGLPAAHVKKVAKTVKKLVLGYQLAGGEEDAEASAEASADGASPAPDDAPAEGGAPGAPADASAAGAGELARQAQKIEQAVHVWEVTERAATQQLRKLQRAVLDLGIEAGTPVVRGLEGIRTRLEKLDDVALVAARAAAAGDATAFAEARDRLRRKLARMLETVRRDPLIADADTNPMVPIRLGETLGKSLTRLLQAF